jgi:hypothetical protein
LVIVRHRNNLVHCILVLSFGPGNVAASRGETSTSSLQPPREPQRYLRPSLVLVPRIRKVVVLVEEGSQRLEEVGMGKPRMVEEDHRKVLVDHRKVLVDQDRNLEEEDLDGLVLVGLGDLEEEDLGGLDLVEVGLDDLEDLVEEEDLVVVVLDGLVVLVEVVVLVEEQQHHV